MSEALIVVAGIVGGALFGAGALALFMAARGGRYVEYIVVAYDPATGAVIERPVASTKEVAWN